MSRSPAISILLALALAAAACGEDERPATEQAEAAAPTAEPVADPTADASSGEGEAKSVVRVSTGEWFVTPEPGEVDAGSVEFEVANDGDVDHEVEVVRTDVAADAFPVKNGKADVDAVGEELGEVEDIEPGAMKEFTVSLEPGKYVLICNLPDHYEPGMYAAFTVR